jgi:hypothetical protein
MIGDQADVVVTIWFCLVFVWFTDDFSVLGKGWRTWRRPTLPCLRTQYHGRWGFSRPSSGWDRVRAPRDDHQVVQPFPVVGLRSSVVRRKARQTGVGWRFWCCVVRGACLRSLDPGTTEDDFHAWCASLPLVTCFLTTDDWRLTTVS